MRRMTTMTTMGAMMIRQRSARHWRFADAAFQYRIVIGITGGCYWLWNTSGISCGCCGRLVVKREQALGQADHAAEPVENDGLEFSARGTSGPWEAHDSETRRQHLADYRRVAVARRKVGVEARVLPMSHARQDFRLEVPEDVFPFLAPLWCLFRQQFAQIAWFDIRCHASFTLFLLEPR